MNQSYRSFLEKSDIVSNDLKHRKTIKFNMSKYEAAVDKGKTRYQSLELGKNFVARRKREALKELDLNLLMFEKIISSRGAKVLWAKNTESVLKSVQKIIYENSAKLIVKSKSMTSEEIDFNEYVSKVGVEPVETDLGEYIVQVAGEKPYHIVTPAMHKSKIDVNKLFTEKFGLADNLSAEELTNFVRVKLREIYQNADIGVTGANFIVADIGGVAVTENEGNALMTTAFPKIHIVIVGIEKVIPSIKDLDRFWPILAVHGTGQAISVYSSIFTGPKKDNEDFGPEKMYVILLDNKRVDLLKEPLQSDSLACIRCGACLNACPIYHNIGGYTYNTTYSGPIGSVISPFLNNFQKSGHLSFACTICGKCTSVCPSKIDLHLLLLHNRNKQVEESTGYNFFHFIMKAFKIASLHRVLFDLGPSGIKNFFISILAKNIFGNKRCFPLFKRSFRKSIQLHP
jgi:L-lactate dehydrogenase complex protein LldF